MVSYLVIAHLLKLYWLRTYPCIEILLVVLLLVFDLLLVFVCCCDRVILCSPGYPGTSSVDQAGPNLTNICLPLPPECRD